MSRLFFHVQYLKGLGHLRRIGLIAAAARDKGAEVHVASGGLPVEGLIPEGVALHQLPALQAGPGGFGDLRDATGAPVDAAWKRRRREALLALYGDISPDVLVIETFPFGRRALAFELLALLEAARAGRPCAAIVCSIRDILQEPRKPERAQESLQRLNGNFDAVMVHGDPAFMRLESSFPLAGRIAPPLFYSGIVAPDAALYEPGEESASGTVVVSAGAGSIGVGLLDTALAARNETPLQGCRWRLIAGPHLPQSDFERLAARAGGEVSVERFVEDFPRVLAGARLSISYAGYNTVADVLRAHVPAVLVAYGGSDGRETEQGMRARRMAELGLAAALPDADLTPSALAGAIAQALRPAAGSGISPALDGAERSAEFLIAQTQRKRR
ncbi:MAG: glycosyltransferase [Methyloligellaceae bacterium]